MKPGTAKYLLGWVLFIGLYGGVAALVFYIFEISSR